MRKREKFRGAMYDFNKELLFLFLVAEHFLWWLYFHVCMLWV